MGEVKVDPPGEPTEGFSRSELDGGRRGPLGGGGNPVGEGDVGNIDDAGDRVPPVSSLCLRSSCSACCTFLRITF